MRRASLSLKNCRALQMQSVEPEKEKNETKNSLFQAPRRSGRGTIPHPSKLARGEGLNKKFLSWEII